MSTIPGSLQATFTNKTTKWMKFLTKRYQTISYNTLVACYILGLGLGLGLENLFCRLSACSHRRQALVQQNKAREGRR